MKKLLNLQDEFDNDEMNHFTNYEYVLQLIDNGYPSVLKEFISTIKVKDLVRYLMLNYECMSNHYTEIFKDEIIKRSGE